LLEVPVPDGFTRRFNFHEQVPGTARTYAAVPPVRIVKFFEVWNSRLRELVPFAVKSHFPVDRLDGDGAGL
jgi:hypothetical protein